MEKQLKCLDECEQNIKILDKRPIHTNYDNEVILKIVLNLKEDNDRVTTAGITFTADER